MKHASTATSTGPVSSLSYLSKENGRIPSAYKTCPMCNGCGMVEHDQIARQRRDSDGRVKVSDGEVQAIKRLHQDGMNPRRIARIFNISRYTVHAYVRGDRRSQ